MEKLTILPMTFPEDKKQISAWKEKYENTDGWENIKKFILEYDTYIDLGEVLETNHEIFSIGDDEKKFAFVAKTNKNEIVAWILINTYDLTTTEPEMFLQYFVINPVFQHQGYGTKILKELFFNLKKYIGIEPYEIFALINQKNIGSLALFKKLNFEFVPLSKAPYFRASVLGPSFETTKNSSTYGE